MNTYFPYGITLERQKKENSFNRSFSYAFFFNAQNIEWFLVDFYK